MKLLEFKLISDINYSDTYPRFYARIKYSRECGYLWWKKTKIFYTKAFKYYDGWYETSSSMLFSTTVLTEFEDRKFIAQLDRELSIAVSELAYKTKKEPVKMIKGCSL